MRQLTIVRLCVLMSLAVLAACGGGSSSTGSSDAADGAGEGDGFVPPLVDAFDSGGPGDDAPAPDGSGDDDGLGDDATSADAGDGGPADVPLPDGGTADVPEDGGAGDADEGDAGGDADAGPAPSSICRPCRTDDECAVPGGGLAWCLPAGPEGAFCASRCEGQGQGDCPAGYTCLDVEYQAAIVRACLPEGGGECPCGPEQQGFVTACRNENTFGSCVGERTCDTACSAPVPAAEACNAVDDDCDGTTDDYTIDCSTVCGPGSDTCTDATWSGCTAPQPTACVDYATCLVGDFCGEDCPDAPEETCNGVDDDCDGTTDGVTQPCTTTCGEGTETCTLGEWVGCTAPAPLDCFQYDTCTPFQTCNVAECPTPPAELCNSKDDDCDGTTDQFTRPCVSDCGEGTETCIASLWTLCNAPFRQPCMDYETCDERTVCVTECPAPPAEECNGVDDDCDGVTDEMTRPCTSICGQGVERCTAGDWVNCTAPPAYDCTDWASCETVSQCTPDCAPEPTETCNGVDDDCDGTTDGMTRPCSTDCGEGDETCVTGDWVGCTAPPAIDCVEYLSCTLTPMCAAECPEPPRELCNNKDDDCDGATDEDTTRTCSTICGSGEQVCVNGQLQQCSAPVAIECVDWSICQRGEQCEPCTERPMEICDNVDNDCDGVTDGITESCGLDCGAGAGQRTCTAGDWSDCTAPGTISCLNYETCEQDVICGSVCPIVPEEACNDRDDDCDSQTDEGSATDLCGVTPASECNGDVRHGFAPIACVAGECVAEPEATLCPWGCAAGDCIPCQGSCVGGTACGDDGCGGSCGECPNGAALNPDYNTLLNILARWYVTADTDYRDVFSSAVAPAGTFDGQLFYLTAASVNGGAPIYGQLGSAPDWMLSMQSTVAGYASQGIVGYSVVDQPNYLCGINAWYSEGRADHATGACTEDLGAAGYTPAHVIGSGFRRYGTDCEVPIPVAGNEVQLVANAVAGGVVSELWWGGRQFLNRYDFGRYIQTALRNEGSSDQPTEAGDRYGCRDAAEGWSHGSPLLQHTASGGGLTTLTYPLQWDAPSLGGDADHPVMWTGTFAKAVQTEFSGSPHIIEWAVTINSSSGSRSLDLDILRATLTADFTQFLVYDAFTDTLTDRSAAVPHPAGCLEPEADPALTPVAGAAILATADGSHALGIYRRAPRNALRFCRFDSGTGTGEDSPDYASIAAVFKAPEGYRPGTDTWTVYVLVGTLDDVRAAAQYLYETLP